MLPGRFIQGIIISPLPVVRTGLETILAQHFESVALEHYPCSAGLSPALFASAQFVIVHLPAGVEAAQNECENWQLLMPQISGIRWLFLLSDPLPESLERGLLTGPEVKLLLVTEPAGNIVNAVWSGSKSGAEENLLITEEKEIALGVWQATLTTSERQVLRLLGKGWGINQIARLLKKSNKTISAQKNSAMRRLALKSNAELYAWINSCQGIRELNVFSMQKEYAEWKRGQSGDTLR